MNKLNVSQWQSFTISELFITESTKNKIQVPTGASIPKTSLIEQEKGGFPRITVTSLNNGIIGSYKKIDDPNYRIFENFISISFLGTIFYHPYKASLDMKVHCLKLRDKELNANIALFLIGVIKKHLYSFAYDDQLSSTVLPTLSILLPTKNYIPDWDYMNNFIENIYKKEIDNQYHITGYIEKSQTREIDLKQWRAFCIGDLFEIKKADVIHSRGVTEYGSDDLDKLHKISVPYIVRTKFNNGIKCRVIKTDTMQPAPSGVISFGAENTTFFYQQEEFVSGRDIYYLDTRNYSKKICLFLISCLQPIAQKYSYNYGLFPDLLKKEMIKLPIDIDGNPDWEYMEQFIDNLYDKEREKIKVILSIH